MKLGAKPGSVELKLYVTVLCVHSCLKVVLIAMVNCVEAE